VPRRFQDKTVRVGVSRKSRSASRPPEADDCRAIGTESGIRMLQEWVPSSVDIPWSPHNVKLDSLLLLRTRFQNVFLSL
jgi:hypothetical protein